MTRSNNQVVLVTGASTGLGLAIARELLSTTHRLILTARTASLPRFAAAGISESPRLWIRPLDVTNDAERRAVIAEANERWNGVDVLINNAGIAFRSVVEHVTPEARDEIHNINYRGPMDLIRLVLPSMRAKRNGCIVNISSVSGMVAMPTLSLYSASKFALEGASEALWYEVRPFGIRVVLVQPGFIRSESFKNTLYTPASRHGLDDGADPYHAHYAHMNALIERLMHSTPADVASVARVVVRTIGRRDPPLRVHGTADANFFAMLRRFLPRGFLHRFLYRRLPGIAEWGRPPTDGQAGSPG
jgi:NAD(P)-dependent dehydrogenase (short-subunit alcohol dehydrogenase family)